MLNCKPLWAIAALGIALTTAPAASTAAEFPSKAVTIILPTVPGGALDNTARLISERLALRLGQPILVDAKPGAAGTLGTGLAASATPDGHTLVWIADSMLTVAPKLVGGNSIQLSKELVPVAAIGSLAMVLVAHPSLGVNNLDEFLAKVRTQPGKISYGSGSNGSAHHLSMALLEREAGIKLNHIPYKGGAQALADVLGGHVPLMFIVPDTVTPHLQSGKLVALGVTSAQRIATLPAVPAIGEKVKGYELESWFALFGPPGLANDVIERLNKEVSAIVSEPEIKRRLAAVGVSAQSSSAAALGQKLHRDAIKMEQLINHVGLTSR